MQLNGPSGGLLISNHWEGSNSNRPNFDHHAFQTLNEFPISSAETLTIGGYHASARPENEEPTVYQTLLRMNNLRTLTLTDCTNLSFLALNPFRNNSNAVACPNLEKLILYAKTQRGLHTQDPLEMARERDSIGVRLSTINVTSWWKVLSGDELFDLRSYASHVRAGSWYW